MTNEELPDTVTTPRGPRIITYVPAVLLTALCPWDLWRERLSLKSAPFYNDMTMHEQMVRFATHSLLHFHWPATQWYSLLNLGSPQFLHYQGLAATFTGFIGIFVTPSVAFRLSLYLLWALWPLAIYFSARIARLSKVTAIASALVACLLSSFPHIGYEAKAFEWLGYGVWAQLCAAWTLPFAWAWSWRATKDAKHAWKAVLFVVITAGLHFETGYSAFGALLLFPFVIPSEFRQRIRNGALLLGCSLLASVWVVLPLLIYSKWAALNNGQESSSFGRGYGADQNLHWLFHGQYFDAGRFPIITIAVGLGILASIVQWRRLPIARAILSLGVLFFLISFGPTTWGKFIDFIPGHADIFFRRFIITVDLAAIYLVGIGIAWSGEILARGSARVFRSLSTRRLRITNIAFAGSVAGLLLALIVTAVAIPSAYDYQSLNNRAINEQLTEQQPDLQYITPIISYLKNANNGRVYAGLPSNWGQQFKFGVGPMYLYLADNDVEQVSTQGWAASLMEEPQTEFEENNLSDYELLGVRYLLLPKGKKSPIPATLILPSGPYDLWEVSGINYFSIVEPSGSLDENKTTLAAQSELIMKTQYFEHHQDFTINYGSKSTKITLPGGAPKTSLGSIKSESIDLSNGEASGVFDLKQSANIVLSASFDPGWQAYVDGVRVPTQMLAPALVSVPVPAGVHTVVFRYQGFRWYLPLFVLAGLALAYAVIMGRRMSARRSGVKDDDESVHDEEPSVHDEPVPALFTYDNSTDGDIDDPVVDSDI